MTGSNNNSNCSKKDCSCGNKRNTTAAHSDSGAEHNTDSAISTEGSGDTGSTGTEQ